MHEERDLRDGPTNGLTRRDFVALSLAGCPAQVEVYKSLHGWCVPDIPADANGPIYNQPEEQAWTKLLALYTTAPAQFHFDKRDRGMT